jgi:hypothetical protein
VTTIAPPPPAPATPPPLSPGGRTAFRLSLIAAAAVLVVGTFASLGAMAWTLASFRVITDSKPLPLAMRSVFVDTGSVPVAVRITADREAREPRADLRMVNLDQLIARTDNGEVVLSGSARRIEVHTDNGDVVTREPISVSESFSSTADNGDLRVDFADTAPRTIDATSQNGDVIIALPPRGPYIVNASTGNGDTAVRVPQATARENPVAVITARSDNGDVIIDDLR